MRRLFDGVSALVLVISVNPASPANQHAAHLDTGRVDHGRQTRTGRVWHASGLKPGLAHPTGDFVAEALTDLFDRIMKV